MALSMQKFREIVFQLLYSRDFDTNEWDEVGSMLMKQLLIPRKAVREAQERAEQIWSKKEELDEKISAKAIGYTLDRIPRVEITLLRLGIFEMLHSDLPPKVAMSEAIRLARKFATAEGSTFVNGVLDAVYQESGNAVSTEQAPI